MRIAVQVPTYNRPAALRRVLEGYARQSDLDFELIVADDGSTDETREVVARFVDTAPFPVRHIWQPDRGYRLARVRNRGIAATQADYLLLTDGDCIPLATHVARHRALAEPGWCVSGSRIMLGPGLTGAVEQGLADPLTWGWSDWLRHRISGQVNRLSPLLFLSPRSRWRYWRRSAWQSTRTANLAVWREDLLRVNGFDESFEGWGREDSDLMIRLLRSGVRNKAGRYAVPVLHLWHRTESRDALAANEARLREVLTDDRIRARAGLQEMAGD